MPERRRPSGPRCRRAPRGPARAGETGVVSLEWVLVLPVLVLAVAGLLEVVGVVRDALLVQDAARAGVRAAATSDGTDAVTAAVRRALPGRDAAVEVTPVHRADGDTVRVTVTLRRRLGPVAHRLEGRAVARVEPSVPDVASGP